jgi:hypothetical protein
MREKQQDDPASPLSFALKHHTAIIAMLHILFIQSLHHSFNEEIIKERNNYNDGIEDSFHVQANSRGDAVDAC